MDESTATAAATAASTTSNTMTSLAAYQLGKLLGDACVGVDDFTAEMTALLERYGFKQGFIAQAVPNLVEAYMNDDEVPIWQQPWYRPFIPSVSDEG